MRPFLLRTALTALRLTLPHERNKGLPSYAKDFSVCTYTNVDCHCPRQTLWFTGRSGIKTATDRAYGRPRTSSVHTHPLNKGDNFDHYIASDAAVTDGTFPIDWSEIISSVACAKQAGELVWGGLPPTDIDALIREEVEKVGSPLAGLMMIYGLYLGVPLRNAEAVMDAMERYAWYYA